MFFYKHDKTKASSHWNIRWLLLNIATLYLTTNLYSMQPLQERLLTSIQFGSDTVTRELVEKEKVTCYQPKTGHLSLQGFFITEYGLRTIVTQTNPTSLDLSWSGVNKQSNVSLLNNLGQTINQANSFSKKHELQKLNLASTDLTDDNLQKIELINLSSLDISDNPDITDKSIGHLIKISKNMSFLYLTGTNISCLGIHTLKQARPTLTICVDSCCCC